MLARHLLVLGMGVVLLMPQPAQAGVYSDDLSRCLVRSTTADDRTVFITWMFGAMSVHPAVKGQSTLTVAQRTQTSKRAAELMQRLIGTDCRSQAVEALKYEGSSAIEPAFSTFGRAAMMEIMNNSDVGAALGEFSNHVDSNLFPNIIKEASEKK
ncbi:MAG: hypothetical protein EBS42_07925 [Caulobacteraceae bacterium]|nr:hypothetical protein [Caulobacteraceae bacterium]